MHEENETEVQTQTTATPIVDLDAQMVAMNNAAAITEGVAVTATEVIKTAVAESEKPKRRGRPPGSKNKLTQMAEAFKKPKAKLSKTKKSPKKTFKEKTVKKTAKKLNKVKAVKAAKTARKAGMKAQAQVDSRLGRAFEVAAKKVGLPVSQAHRAILYKGAKFSPTDSTATIASLTTSLVKMLEK